MGQAAVQANLSHFCEASQGIDIIPLAFLFQYGAPLVPGGNFGACNLTVKEAGPVSAACQQVADDIKYCQSQKKTILLSLGGAGGNYGLSNQSDAETLAQELWAMYGPVQDGYTGPRPLGDVVIDGFDLDTENGVGAFAYYFLVWKLRELFATDQSRQYFLSGAPQCVVPDSNMGDMIFNAPFDYLFIQFYNTPNCAARGEISGYLPEYGRNQYFSFDAWRQFTGISFSQSSRAKLFIGLPSSAAAASSAEEYLCTSASQSHR